MKSHPILFNTPMVQALLAGRKTQTRRAVKRCGLWESTGGDGMRPMPEACPYGKAGDMLWVRETWMPVEHDIQPCRYRATNPSYAGKWRSPFHMPRIFSRITLRLGEIRAERLQDISYEDAVAEGMGLADMRFEPVTDGETWEQTARRLRWPQRSYEQLWESINGKGSWAANPWVWALTFERVK